MAIQLLNNLSKVGKTVIQVGKIHAPKILTGSGIGLLVSAAPFAVRGVLKLEKECEEEYDICTVDDRREFLFGKYADKKQTAKLVAKNFWPSTLCVVAGTTCVILGLTDQMKRTQAVASLLTMKVGELESLQKAVEENASDAKKKKIFQEAEANRAKTLCDAGEEVVVSDGGIKFIDMWSGTKFTSTFEAVNLAFSNFSFDCVRNGVIEYGECVNQLRYRLGLPPIDVGECCFIRLDQGDDTVKPVYGEPFEENGCTRVPLRYSVEPHQELW